jgi:hypothetical protein
VVGGRPQVGCKGGRASLSPQGWLDDHSPRVIQYLIGQWKRIQQLPASSVLRPSRLPNYSPTAHFNGTSRLAVGANPDMHPVAPKGAVFGSHGRQPMVGVLGVTVSETCLEAGKLTHQRFGFTGVGFTLGPGSPWVRRCLLFHGTEFARGPSGNRPWRGRWGRVHRGQTLFVVPRNGIREGAEWESSMEGTLCRTDSTGRPGPASEMATAWRPTFGAHCGWPTFGF